MEIIDPSLGMFSLLPAEIRRKIWKHISPQLHVSRSRPTSPDQLSQDQAILLVSRKFYAELIAEVPSGFNDHAIYISISSEYEYKSWIRAKNSSGVQWNFESSADAVLRGFCDLPWHELEVRIQLWAPSKEDKGQIICLYKKVRALVELFKGAKGFRAFRAIFDHTGGTSWFDGQQPQCSIRKGNSSPTSGVFPWARWDYQFIFPLLLQIQNVKKAEISLKEMINENQQNLIMQNTFRTGERIMKRAKCDGLEAKAGHRYYGKSIEKHLDRLFLLAESILDDLPSTTANMLRLDRFSSWYTDRLHGNSAYKSELQRLLLLNNTELDQHLELVKVSADHRYRMMRVYNPLSLASRSAFPGTLESTKYSHLEPSDWSQDAWHSVYNHGIPPLHSEESTERYWKWNMENDGPNNDDKTKELFGYFHSRRAE